MAQEAQVVTLRQAQGPQAVTPEVAVVAAARITPMMINP
jgi:hypothetical protein